MKKFSEKEYQAAMREAVRQMALDSERWLFETSRMAEDTLKGIMILGVNDGQQKNR